MEESDSSQGVRSRNDSQGGLNRRSQHRIVRDVHRNFRESFEEIDQDAEEVIEELNTIETLKEFASMEVNQPSFPYLIFSLALFLDILDFGQLTIVWWIVMVFINIGFGVYLFFWMSKRLSGMFRTSSKILYRTRLGKYVLIKTARKFLTRRLAYFFVINIIPVLGILASNAFFIFLAHNHMNKIAKMYIELIEDAGKKLRQYR